MPMLLQTRKSQAIKVQRGSVLFLIPSFYGLLMWSPTLALYLSKVIPWNKTSPLALSVFVGTLIAYFLATIVFFHQYTRWYSGHLNRLYQMAETPLRYANKLAIAGMLVVGMAAIVIRFKDITQLFGGFSSALTVIFFESYKVRWQEAEVTSMATQLSYIGWIGCALVIYYYRVGKLSFTWVAAAIIQLVGNILWIDRTRPLWILFVWAMVWIISSPSLDLKRLGLRIAYVLLTFAVLFTFIGSWIGKTGEGLKNMHFNDKVPPMFIPLLANVTGGYAYFSDLIEESPPYDNFEGTLYPIYAALSPIVGHAPRSQVLEMRSVPIELNVGTILEPFYQDGGIPYVIFGVLIISFGINYLGLLLLRIGRPISYCAWAAVCFISFTAFFTPKIASTPTWVFVAFGVSPLFFPMGRRRTASHDAPPRRIAPHSFEHRGQTVSE